MRLSDCFIDIIAYVTYGMQHGGNFPNGSDALSARLDDLIRQSESLSVKYGFERTGYEQARFAVLAWVDETIMRSSCPGKGGWSKKLLQRRYYKTFDGGEEFYKRLGELEPENQEVREVYFMCLSLGFSGRYGMKGENITERDSIKAQTLKRLTGSTDALAGLSRQKVFPEAYCTHSDETKPKYRLKRSGILMAVALGAGPFCVFAFLYVVYRFILNNEIMTKVAR
jgi:type VI secretion system protein ImpK